MKQFIKQICEEQKVYILTSEQGFAISYSEDYEYEDGSNLEVICFWSTSYLAEKAKNNKWENNLVEIIKLNIFLEEWLFGMVEEVSLVGINFDEFGKGEEKEPLDIVLSIIHELKIQNRSIQLNYFKNLDEIKKFAIEIKESLF